MNTELETLKHALMPLNVRISKDRGGFLIQWGSNPLDYLWQRRDQVKDGPAVRERVEFLMRPDITQRTYGVPTYG